jgi:hypothetical protein
MSLKAFMWIGGILLVAAGIVLVYTTALPSIQSVGYFMQAVLQGAFVLAKAKKIPEVASECHGHLQRYLGKLLGQPGNNNRKEKKS